MAARFWVTGGTGDWNSTTNWSATTGGASGASVPGSADTAAFDANSGSGIATLDISPDIQTLTCTGFKGTLAFGTNTISLNSTGTIFTGATTMTVTGTPLIICTNATATGRTISPQIVTEANSISFNINAGTGSVTLTSNQSFKNVDFTGFTGSLGSSSPVIYGNFTLGAGMTVTGGATIAFAATSGTSTITSNGVALDKNITFNSSGSGATFKLQDALTSGPTRATTLTAGTLDLNGNDLTTGIFSTSGALTRSIIFRLYEGIYVTSASNTTVYTASDSTNFTVVYSGSPNTNSVYVTGVGLAGNTRSITPGLTSSGGSEANVLNFVITDGADTINLGTANRVFRNISFFDTFTGNLGTNVAPQIYGNVFLENTMTVNGGTNNWVFKSTTTPSLFDTANLPLDTPITVNGVGGVTMLDGLDIGSKTLTLISGTLKLYTGVTNTVGSLVTTSTLAKSLESLTPGVQASIDDASGVNSVSYLTIKDSAATGGATWNAFYDQGNINAGNNSGWYFGDSPTVGNEITMRLRSFTQPRRF